MTYMLFDGVRMVYDTKIDTHLKAIKLVRQLIAVMFPARDVEIYENKEQDCFYVHIHPVDILNRDMVLCLRESK